MIIETKFNLGDKVYYMHEFSRGNLTPRKVTKIEIVINDKLTSPYTTYQLDNDAFSKTDGFNIFEYKEAKEKSLEWLRLCIDKISKGKEE